MSFDANPQLHTHAGAKALRLQELCQAGFNVPEFIVLPPQYLRNLHQEDVMSDVLQALPEGVYAVRSAAAEEDGVNSAQAGKFLSKLAVKPEALHEAVAEVFLDAQKKVPAAERNFSIIIQRFIEPQSAGVLFTRNPLGGREVIVNYAHGRGDQVVAGKNVTSQTYFTHPTKEQSQQLAFMPELYELGKEIERLYQFPQDIEWAYAAGEVYILQTRPVTSLTENNYAEYEYLDAHLPEAPFYFEQTSVAESMPHPTPLALSLLDFLYRPGGPVENVYQELGIQYVPHKQFLTIGNQLYVDKHAETKTLFPALGHLKHESVTAKLESRVGVWATMKNTIKFNLMPTRIRAIDRAHIVSVLSKKSTEPQSLYQSLHRLSQEYTHVFQINLLAQLALARFQATIRNPEKTQKYLQLAQPTLEIALHTDSISEDLLGNSISIDDESTFVAQDFQAKSSDESVQLSFTERALLPKAVQVQNWLMLRELGRWLTVKLISDVRKSVFEIAQKNGLTDTRLVYFATLDELQNTLPSNSELKKRQEMYDTATQYDFPKRIASFAITQAADKAVQVLSPGRATGMLCKCDDIQKLNTSKILFVENLTPDLTAYFSDIKGIVCANGALLSHLAIMAREANIPVVLHPKGAGFLYKEITIDDTTQELVHLSKES
jgi:phosphohistidine swiveling domain-containing protein